ncbi:SDR family NAD(P)-dependent oxidoreductase, partial [Bizionia paragorgiae]|uniref:SDR family NAD(P)-dependent oxidoreductase n=1 Tax=Bizionia paragorgiae TaxID=283786 RepID=UPI00299DADE7
CGRRQERLDALKAELSKYTQVHTLTFDVKEKDAVFNAIDSLPKDFKTIDILINNAGNAHGLDPIQEGNLDDWDAMMDSNVKGLLYVSKAIIPQMTARQSGHIINIGSSAGKEVYPKGNVYCASKHAVLALTEGMRIDLNPFGIKVGAINPGLVETEFSKVRFKGDTVANSVYKGYKALQPEDIADIIYFVVTQPPHVNIADLLVFPTAQANSTLVKKEL